MTLPTKTELQQGGIVDFTDNHKGVVTNTLKIAKPLGKRHHDITRKVDSLVKKLLIDKRELSLIYFIDSANRKQKAYELTEESALQVIMGLSGDKAEQLHKEIAHAFVEMKDELSGWQSGKLFAANATKFANDAIHRLGIRLTNEYPESAKGRLIYIHFQNAMNVAITGKSKIDRSELAKEQLIRLAMLEIAVNEAIEARVNEDSMLVRDETYSGIKSGELREKIINKDKALSLLSKVKNRGLQNAA